MALGTARSFWVGFCRQEQGNAALEFVLAVPVVLLLIFFMVDLARILITDSLLQSSLATLIDQQRMLHEQGQENVSSEELAFKLRQIVNVKGSGWVKTGVVTLSTIPMIPEEGGGFQRFEVSYPFTLSTPFAGDLIGAELVTRKIRLFTWNKGME